MPSTNTPRPHQTYTRDSDSKVFTVRTLHRHALTATIAASDGSGAFVESYVNLRTKYTAS